MGWIIIVGFSPVVLWQFVQAAYRRGARRLHHLYALGEMLYPVGVGCKGAAVGTLFMRYHLSDFGFPLFVGFTLFHGFWKSYTDDNPQLAQRNVFERSLEAVYFRRRLLLVALGLSYAYECFTGLLYHFSHIEVQLVGTFDWWDMLLYTLGAGFGFGLLAVWQRQIEAHKSEYDAAQAAVEEAAQEARRTARRQRRRTRPARRSDGKRRRGGR